MLLKKIKLKISKQERNPTQKKYCNSIKNHDFSPSQNGEEVYHRVMKEAMHRFRKYQMYIANMKFGTELLVCR